MRALHRRVARRRQELIGHSRQIPLEPVPKRSDIGGAELIAVELAVDMPEGERQQRQRIGRRHERDDALHHGYTADEYDREMREMLYDRNASWIAAIEQLHAAGGGFVAVGALHLLGPHSVLALLAAHG